MNPENTELNTCGCCEGAPRPTPGKIYNDAGKSVLMFRTGTHGTFKASMLRSLAVSNRLGELTVKEDDDFTIGLTDAWAVVLDILTFYNERIVNEGFLRTSTERLSLAELARHISYRPRPGVAASTWLSFMMDESPGAPLKAIVPAGMKVQSIPGQDEKPQVFETIETIVAKTEWNTIKPKLTEKQILVKGSTQLYLQGINTQLQAGDPVLIAGEDRFTNAASEKWCIRTIQTVSMDENNNRTLITWQDGLKDNEPTNEKPRVCVFRQRAALFGYNAPDVRSIPDELDFSNDQKDNDWNVEKVIDESSQTVFLDIAYPKILKNSWIVFVSPSKTALYKVENAEISAKTAFTLANKSSKIKLDTNISPGNFDLRETLVLAQSEELSVAEAPVFTPVSGKMIKLDKPQSGLRKDQLIVIQGQPEQYTGDVAAKTSLIPVRSTSMNQPEVVSEVAVIEEIDDSGRLITLTSALQHVYQRNTVEINANVAPCTHGETKSEILGSGNGTLVFQKFKLKQKPLTYIASSTPGGTESTLEVRVNNIRWKEVPTFYGRSPGDRVYLIRTDDDGTTTIQFGDGIVGTRLPSGNENIRARYRTGIGFEGEVRAGQLSLQLTPQLGVRSVVNPLPASGADEPEPREKIMRNAPLTVLTLDRIVSATDYENFANAYAGIGKARADLMWKGEDRMVHITVASASGGFIDNTLRDRLTTAIDNARDGNFQVVINNYEKLLFGIKAKIRIKEDYSDDKVIAKAKEVLNTRFGFRSRIFGQGVTPAEVIAVLHAVEGVTAVDLDELGGRDPFSVPHFGLASLKARWDAGAIKPAQLLLVDPDHVEIDKMG